MKLEGFKTTLKKFKATLRVLKVLKVLKFEGFKTTLEKFGTTLNVLRVLKI